MPSVELDLRRLDPGEAPRDIAPRTGRGGRRAGRPRAGARALRRPRPAAQGGPQRHRCRWPGSRAATATRSGLARALGIGTGEPRDLTLVRDDHGGVLLHHGRLEAAGDGRRSLSRRLGLQAHHDDIKVADGEITRIDVRPEWRAVDTIAVTVMTLPLRPTRQTSGRALQVACDPARIVRDGVPYPRPVTRWTWYADDRVRWRLQP